MSIRAAFQGDRGAFSEQAALTIVSGDVESLPCKDFEAMFQAVASGQADCGLAPIENTLMGSIIKNYDLLLERDLTIIGEVVLRIVHNLIAPPGVTVDEVRRIYSQAPALAQCERFLSTLKNVEIIPSADTAGSVRLVMQNGRRDEAAIASARAAEAFGAQVIAPGIESNAQNFTRFFVLARPDRAAKVPLRSQSQERKTSVVFRVAHKPGALYRALSAFADEDVDLTKVESRPIEGRPWEYSFYLDFLGDREEPNIERAMGKLSGVAESVRVLGSYARAEPA